MNFYQSGFKMSGIQMVIHYSDHHSNIGPTPAFKCSLNFVHILIQYSSSIQLLDHSAIGLVRYSDPSVLGSKSKFFPKNMPKPPKISKIMKSSNQIQAHVVLLNQKSFLLKSLHCLPMFFFFLFFSFFYLVTCYMLYY